jgi:amidophosphoribosyltransferase
MLKTAGATEVHMRISSPPTRNPCHYGIDTPRRKELIAATHDLEATRTFIEADSLGYLSLEGMFAAFGKGEDEMCAACFSGRYPVPLTLPDPQAVLFPPDEEEDSDGPGATAVAPPSRW